MSKTQTQELRTRDAVDPLDRLRKLGSNGRRGHELTDHGHELTGLADAWLHERRRHAMALRDLEERIKALEENELENAEDNDRLRAERDGLQTRFDVSMPLPLDADGYVWDSYEEEFINRDGERVRIGEDTGLMYTQENWFLGDEHNRWDPAETCRHIEEDIPRLKRLHNETIEDVRGDAEKRDCEYFGHKRGEPCNHCPAFDGGKCNGSAARVDLVRRAYECGQRDGDEQ